MLTELRKNIEFSLRGERGMKGQIFPFLILIMVVMIVAVMVFVNVAQVNTQKLATMNAADAGALAGAAQLASTANYIAGKNSGWWGLPAQFLYRFPAFARPLNMVTGPNWRFYGMYLTSGIWHLKTFYQLVAAGVTGVQMAGAQAVTAGFGNMPIEEPQQRVGSVTGEQKVPSRFAKYLHDEDFFTKLRTKEYTYPWYSHYYNITEDKQMQRQQPDYAAVKIKKPRPNAIQIMPAPAAPWISFYQLKVPQCIGGCPPPAGDCCMACAIFLATVWLPAYTNMAVVHPIVAGITFKTITFLAMLEALIRDVSADVASIMLMVDMAVSLIPAGIFPIPIVPPLWPVICGGTTWTMVLYWVPVPFIAAILNKDDDASISVEVTRFSPTRDLGLWQFKERKITSGAKAMMTGGSAFSDNYKVQMDKVWDGKQL